jgi:hypothetical protein
LYDGGGVSVEVPVEGGGSGRSRDALARDALAI